VIGSQFISTRLRRLFSTSGIASVNVLIVYSSKIPVPDFCG
jgi:hypothetical protein